MREPVRLALLTVLALGLLPTAAWAQYPSEVVDFENNPDEETSHEMFRIPEYSGATSQFILANTSGFNNNNAWRETSYPTLNDAALRVFFRWVDPNDPDSWVRLTSFNGEERPNPALHVAGKVRFNITNVSEMSQGEIGICIGIRETGVDVPQLADGGLGGTIEWVGVDTTPNGIVAGDNHIVNTTADPNDVQVWPVGTNLDDEGLPLGTAVVAPGPDGVLTTTPELDDQVRFGYFISAAGARVPIPAITLPPFPMAESLQWDLSTGNVWVGDPNDPNTLVEAGITGFTGDGVLNVTPPRGTLEHIAIVNLAGDAAVLIDFAIDELQVEATEADPIPRPTVVAPIRPGDLTVTVADIDPAATLVTLKVDNGVDPDLFDDPNGLAEVVFTLPHIATAGDAYTATQTIGGEESVESEPVRVALPPPVIGLLPAAGHTSVRVTQIDSVATFVELFVGEISQGTVAPGGAFTVDIDTLAQLEMGQEVTATQGIDTSASDPSDTAIVTTDQITDVFCDHFDYANQGAFDLVWAATTGDTQLVLSDYWNATPTPDSQAAYSSEVGENRSQLITGFTDAAGTDTVPIIWTVNFFDDASNYAVYRQYAELRGESGAILALGKYNNAGGGTATHYSARVVGGGPLWFSLDDPGAPGLSNGWHTLTAVIKSSTIDYYVDGILSKHNVSRTGGIQFGAALLGSGLTSAGGGAWYDDYCVQVGALSFPTITPQPPDPPTVEAPILPGSLSVTVVDIDPNATLVSLFRDDNPLDSQDPDGADSFVFGISEAIGGQVFTATQTVQGVPSRQSEPVTVAYPAPVIYQAPAAGDTSVLVIELLPGTQSVTVVIDGTTEFSEVPDVGVDRWDVTVSGLDPNEIVTAYYTAAGTDSVESDPETVTTSTTTVVMDCEDFELYADQAAMESVWTQGGEVDVLLSDDRNATCPDGIQSALTPPGKSWMHHAIPETTPSAVAPVVLNVNIYDPKGVDPEGSVVQWVELNYYGGSGPWFLLHVGILGWADTDNVHYDMRLIGLSGPDWIDLDEYDAPERSVGWHTFTVVHKGDRIDVYVDGLLAKKNAQLSGPPTYARADVGSGGYTSSPGVYFDDFCVETGPVWFGCIAPQPPNKPAIGAPIEDGDEIVTVTNVDQDVTLVEIYDEVPTLIGTYTGPVDETREVDVNLFRALVHLERITAEVTNVIGVEVSDPLEVGKGNGDVLICIGIRETNDQGALGSPGGSDGPIEWIGATGIANGAPQGVPISPSSSWQTLVFDPNSDPILSFYQGNGQIDVARGTLEHLAIAVDANSPDRSAGQYLLYVDNVINVGAGDGGSDFVIADFEGFGVGTEVLFQEPTNSGSTGGDMTPLPSASEVSDAAGNPGQSELLVWFWKDTTDQRWARITTFDATETPNPIIDLTKPIQMDILLLPGLVPCRGDTNCDGWIDFGDINAFVDALSEGVYCDGTGYNADIDGNGSPGFEDINPFVALLTGYPLPIECPGPLAK